MRQMGDVPLAREGRPVSYNVRHKLGIGTPSSCDGLKGLAGHLVVDLLQSFNIRRLLVLEDGRPMAEDF